MWRVSGEAHSAEFDGNRLEMRPISAADFLDFVEAESRADTEVAVMRCRAQVVVKSAHKDGARFFADDDADELVRWAIGSRENAIVLASLVDASAKACGIDVEQARKN